MSKWFWKLTLMSWLVWFPITAGAQVAGKPKPKSDPWYDVATVKTFVNKLKHSKDPRVSELNPKDLEPNEHAYRFEQGGSKLAIRVKFNRQNNPLSLSIFLWDFGIRDIGLLAVKDADFNGFPELVLGETFKPPRQRLTWSELDLKDIEKTNQCKSLVKELFEAVTELQIK